MGERPRGKQVGQEMLRTQDWQDMVVGWPCGLEQRKTGMTKQGPLTQLALQDQTASAIPSRLCQHGMNPSAISSCLSSDL